MSLAEAVLANTVASKAPMSRNLFRAVREVECGEVLIISPFDLRGVGCVGIFLNSRSLTAETTIQERRGNGGRFVWQRCSSRKSVEPHRSYTLTGVLLRLAIPKVT